jgi:peptide/nickel transport system permease protein
MSSANAADMRLGDTLAAAIVRPSARQRMRTYGRRAGSCFAIGVLIIVGVCCIAPGLIAPGSPTAINPDHVLAGPSLHFLFGTDQFGRDMASRIAFGARSAVLIGLLSAGIGGSIGAMIGIVAGFFGGPVDLAIMRLVDLLMAFPSLLLALTVVMALGSGLPSVIGAVAISAIPLFARVVRGETLRLKAEPFIDAARSTGLTPRRVAATHIVPNLLPTFVVLYTVTCGSAILTGSALNFLGLGVSGDSPDWGYMLASGRDYLEVAWWVATFPGAAIALLVLCLNVVGDRLQDRLDPRRVVASGAQRIRRYTRDASSDDA